MKIKRFVAEDMRSALRKVSETLGPDAVILSNNKVDGGIEIVAAIDYDESLINEPATAPVIQKPNPFIQNDDPLSKAHIEQRNREAALDDVKYGRNIPAAMPKTKINDDIRETRIEPTMSTPSKEHLWTEEPAFMDMKSELKSLKGLLVNPV